MSDTRRIESELLRKPITPLERLFLGFWMVVLPLIVVICSLDSSTKPNDDALLKSEMLRLAEAGKPAAIIWASSRNYITYTSEGVKTKALAEAGDLNSMYLHGRNLENAGELDSAFDWYEKAAAQGHVNALLKVLKKRGDAK